MIKKLLNKLFQWLHDKADHDVWVAGRADPTEIQTFTWNVGYLEIEIRTIWEAELTVQWKCNRAVRLSYGDETLLGRFVEWVYENLWEIDNPFDEWLEDNRMPEWEVSFGDWR